MNRPNLWYTQISAHHCCQIANQNLTILIKSMSNQMSSCRVTLWVRSWHDSRCCEYFLKCKFKYLWIIISMKYGLLLPRERSFKGWWQNISTWQHCKKWMLWIFSTELHSAKVPIFLNFFGISNSFNMKLLGNGSFYEEIWRILLSFKMVEYSSNHIKFRINIGIRWNVGVFMVCNGHNY